MMSLLPQKSFTINGLQHKNSQDRNNQSEGNLGVKENFKNVTQKFIPYLICLRFESGCTG